jgi:hypothetical protein
MSPKPIVHLPLRSGRTLLVAKDPVKNRKERVKQLKSRIETGPGGGSLVPCIRFGMSSQAAPPAVQAAKHPDTAPPPSHSRARARRSEGTLPRLVDLKTKRGMTPDHSRLRNDTGKSGTLTELSPGTGRVVHNNVKRPAVGVSVPQRCCNAAAIARKVSAAVSLLF